MSTSLTFVTPPPGFAPLTDFVLDGIDGASGLHSLRAVGSDSIRLFVLDAAVYVPEYSPYLSDEQSGSLGITRPEDAIVLVVANPGEGGTTMNLMAPIIVNRSTGLAAQVILEGQDWPLRAQLAAVASAG